MLQVMNKHVLKTIYQLMLSRFSGLTDHDKRHLDEIDDWVDCWVRCAEVLVHNEKKAYISVLIVIKAHSFLGLVGFPQESLHLFLATH